MNQSIRARAVQGTSLTAPQLHEEKLGLSETRLRDYFYDNPTNPMI
jgi:hypothetical protein